MLIPICSGPRFLKPNISLTRHSLPILGVREGPIFGTCSRSVLNCFLLAWVGLLGIGKLFGFGKTSGCLGAISVATLRVLSPSRMRINGLAHWGPITFGLSMPLTSPSPPCFCTLSNVFQSHNSRDSQTLLRGPTIMAHAPWNLPLNSYIIHRMSHSMLHDGNGFGP